MMTTKYLYSWSWGSWPCLRWMAQLPFIVVLSCKKRTINFLSTSEKINHRIRFPVRFLRLTPDPSWFFTFLLGVEADLIQLLPRNELQWFDPVLPKFCPSFAQGGLHRQLFRGATSSRWSGAGEIRSSKKEDDVGYIIVCATLPFVHASHEVECATNEIRLNKTSRMHMQISGLRGQLNYYAHNLISCAHNFRVSFQWSGSVCLFYLFIYLYIVLCL